MSHGATFITNLNLFVISAPMSLFPLYVVTFPSQSLSCRNLGLISCHVQRCLFLSQPCLMIHTVFKIKSGCYLSFIHCHTKPCLLLLSYLSSRFNLCFYLVAISDWTLMPSQPCPAQPWLANISANFRKNSKLPLCYFQGLGGKMIHEKTWSKNSRDTVPLSSITEQTFSLAPFLKLIWTRAVLRPLTLCVLYWRKPCTLCLPHEWKYEKKGGLRSRGFSIIGRNLQQVAYTISADFLLLETLRRVWNASLL